jgi:hypothetical protein
LSQNKNTTKPCSQAVAFENTMFLYCKFFWVQCFQGFLFLCESAPLGSTGLPFPPDLFPPCPLATKLMSVCPCSTRWMLERNPCKIFQVCCRKMTIWSSDLQNSPQLISCNYLLEGICGALGGAGFWGFCHLATFDTYFWLNRLGTCKRSLNLLPGHISRPHVVWVNHETLLLQCRLALLQDNGHAIEH